jgi:hypothetical protein
MQSTIQTPDPKNRRLNRIKLMILWLIPVGLMALAGISYYLVQSGRMSVGSTNNGILIQPPIQLNELLADSLQLQADEPGSPWQGKWTLVIRGNADCAPPCSAALQLSRQIHIRLDKNANRVQRLLLTDQLPLGAAIQTNIAEQHRFLKVATADAQALAEIDNATTSAAAEPAQFFVVDPQGWAMMYYLAEHEGNAVLKDLKHLLKYSVER